MPLLDRVMMLIRANLNDLVDKAQDPEKLLKQLLLDMQNQYLQVKTQLAIAIANQHLLEKKQRESLGGQTEWVRKAEVALQKNEQDLARTALERSLTYENAARNYAEQIEDQAQQVQLLRDALHRLEQKMTETRSKTAAFERLREKVSAEGAAAYGQMAAPEPSTEQRLAELERSDRVEQLLADLKNRVHAS